MVFIVYGTTAEYIKLMPLILELKQRGICYTIALSQHEEQLQKFFKIYSDMPKPDLWLVHGFRGRDLDRFYQAPLWALKVVGEVIRSWRTVRRHAHADRARNAWLVHGDTFTTVFGAVWGRLMGYPVGHVEAGLRSHNLLHPLPEEIDRLIVTRLARMHFAPGDIPVTNLKQAKGSVVNTHVNTSYDSIAYAQSRNAPVTVPGLPKYYGIISLHRTEFVANRPVFKRTIETLAEYGGKMPLVFLNQPVTIALARDMGLNELIEKNFLSIPKLDYLSFIKFLDQADFVVTDSGGLQEDCTYMNKPCLIIRKATERQEGLAEGITKLSYYDDRVLRSFLDNPRAAIKSRVKPPVSPTQVVINYLEKHNYLAQ
jgi:UDP-N-acetylglucosamine 2-epimerase (non-hydrolysing)